MKIGYYCESPADAAALAIFTRAVLGEPAEPISMDLEAHSVPGFFRSLGGVFRGVHYNSDAEGLVVVVDSDETELHDASHDQPGIRSSDCRFCQIREIIEKARRQLKARQGMAALRVAIGFAVPAIEAWYQLGKNHHVGEITWKTGCAANHPPVAKPHLKKLVYGTERPSLALEIECAKREAQRVVTDLAAIESAFPVGFGLMAKEIRSWRAPSATNPGRSG